MGGIASMAGGAASTIMNALTGGTQGASTASSVISEMQQLSDQSNQMTLASAQMQLQQSMTAALANVMKSGASNVKNASQAG